MAKKLEPLVAAAALSFVVGATSKVWLTAACPHLAVTCAYQRKTRLHSLASPPSTYDPADWSPPALDPWRRPWRVDGMGALAGYGYFYLVYSAGPDGLDDQGEGDDLWPGPDPEHPRRAAVFSGRPGWPILHLDLVLMLGVPSVLWWGSALERVWRSSRQPLAREASLCVVAAGWPVLLLGWSLLQLRSPPSLPWSVVDPGVALAASGALGCVLSVAAVRAWRLRRSSEFARPR